MYGEILQIVDILRESGFILLGQDEYESVFEDLQYIIDSLLYLLKDNEGIIVGEESLHLVIKEDNIINVYCVDPDEFNDPENVKVGMRVQKI